MTNHFTFSQHIEKDKYNWEFISQSRGTGSKLSVKPHLQATHLTIQFVLCKPHRGSSLTVPSMNDSPKRKLHSFPQSVHNPSQCYQP